MINSIKAKRHPMVDKRKESKEQVEAPEFESKEIENEEGKYRQAF